MEPDVARVPDQVPLAAQVVALELVQERVALWPGMTAPGLMATLTVAGGAAWVMAAAVLPLLQPERTKAERKSITKTREKAIREPVGSFIRPSFYEPMRVHVGLKESNTE